MAAAGQSRHASGVIERSVVGKGLWLSGGQTSSPHMWRTYVERRVSFRMISSISSTMARRTKGSASCALRSGRGRWAIDLKVWVRWNQLLLLESHDVSSACGLDGTTAWCGQIARVDSVAALSIHTDGSPAAWATGVVRTNRTTVPWSDRTEALQIERPCFGQLPKE